MVFRNYSIKFRGNFAEKPIWKKKYLFFFEKRIIMAILLIIFIIFSFKTILFSITFYILIILKLDLIKQIWKKTKFN